VPGDGYGGGGTPKIGEKKGIFVFSGLEEKTNRGLGGIPPSTCFRALFPPLVVGFVEREKEQGGDWGQKWPLVSPLPRYGGGENYRIRLVVNRFFPGGGGTSF